MSEKYNFSSMANDAGVGKKMLKYSFIFSPTGNFRWLMKRLRLVGLAFFPVLIYRLMWLIHLRGKSLDARVDDVSVGEKEGINPPPPTHIFLLLFNNG